MLGFISDAGLISLALAISWQPRPGINVASSQAQGPISQNIEILIAAHGHPQLSNGGAEISAFELFSAFSSRTGFKSSFLGCAQDQFDQRLGATVSQPFSDREYLYSAAAFDWFKFSNRDPTFPSEFRRLLEALAPRIVHFHHYANFGVEAFLHVKRTLPDCKIVLTLHEFLAMCHHYGQMVRSDRQTLCYESTPLRCHGCFKALAPSDFFLREQYIKRFFELVDHFISPSAFLAERYVSWGVPKERVSVIENLIPSPQPQNREVDFHGEPILRVGFFGQISLLKGINVLFDAARILKKAGESNIVFEIFGDYRSQPPEFQTDFSTRLSAAGYNVKYHGHYEHLRVDRLMCSVDLVLVPSIWWENSALVIQEALRNRRPVVCSDIGGMAEKVIAGRDGFHFAVGNAVALVNLLRRLAADRERLAAVTRSIQTPPPPEEIVAQHEVLYRQLLA
jgi:glycosyltransferase involved in cell wall biosynthesis